MRALIIESCKTSLQRFRCGAVAYVIPARVSDAREESRNQCLDGQKIGILRAAATRENDKPGIVHDQNRHYDMQDSIDFSRRLPRLQETKRDRVLYSWLVGGNLQFRDRS